MNRIWLLLLLVCLITSCRTNVAVLTEHNNLAHTGANLAERILNTNNVNTNTFGLLYTRPVDDQLYAQPLIAPKVKIPGKGVRNLVILATANNSVYAYDADDSSVTEPYWTNSFNHAPNVIAPNREDMSAIGACGGDYHDFSGNCGIVGTPVIDPASGTIYLVARTREFGTNFVQRLHALDIRTGKDRPNSPVVITATYPGTGAGSVNGTITFDPVRQNQRAALVLVKGVVYISWSSFCDLGPYHGWIIGYDAKNLARVVVYNNTPDGGDGGIWMSGDGLSADADGNLYLSVGNGSVGVKGNPRDPVNRGESFLKLKRNGSKLDVVSWFTPFNYENLERGDVDLGSASLMLIPRTRLVFSGGKQGVGYLADRDHMGGLSYSNADTNILQTFRLSSDQIHGGMVWWDSPAGSFGYMWPASTFLQQYKFNRATNRFELPAFAKSATSAPGGQPGGILAVSADGAKAGSGIVWAVHQMIGDANHTVQPGFFHAYDAQNIGHELWNSEQIPTRDHVASFAKFVPPTVANGKVYLATFSGQLNVYGLSSGWVAAPAITPSGGAFTNSTTVTLTDTTPAAKIFYTMDGNTPTTNSTLYTGPFTLTNTTVIKAKAFKAGFVDSGALVTTLVNSSAFGTGTGLLGAYYSTQFKSFTNPPTPTLTRTDATVNFDWGYGSPAPEISADNFSVRWTGSVQPLISGNYMFYTSVDDGCRLWINDQLIINDWRSEPSEQSGTFAMIGQQRYNIRMDYYEERGQAKASLSWSNPSMTKQIVPQTQLYPASNPPPAVNVISPADGSVYTGSASVTIAASAAAGFNTLDRVDFYTNNILLGSLGNGSAGQSNTLALTATGLAPGNYSVKAVAWDITGLASTSAPVHITVNAGTGLRYGLTNRIATSPFLNLPSNAGGAVPPLLSLTGVFTNTPNMTVTPGLIPYSVNVPMWADFAAITHYAAIPSHGAPCTPDQQITFSPTGSWTFPAGSVFVQTFQIATNEANPTALRRLETRLLVRRTNGAVYGVTYKWRADNSDADLLTENQTEDISVATATGTRTQTWYYPNQIDCLICHTPASGYVLGMNTRQLNGDFSYPAAAGTDNQLRALNRLGLLNPAINEADISNYPRLSALTNATASVEERFRSYLDVNCAECHRPGSAGVTMDARYDTPLANQKLINVVPARGTVGFENARIVTPHDPNRSVLLARMNTTNVLFRMPQLGRSRIDTNAVQLTTDWINSLP
jgi:uncharacterized repeat protein (TIGR03806 family)